MKSEISRRGFLKFLALTGISTSVLALGVRFLENDRSAWSIDYSSIPHPRLLIGADDVEGIRHRAEAYCWARDAWNTLLLRADQARTIPLEIPGRGGQWPGHYVCTVHNVSLQTLSAHLHQCPIGKELYSGWPYDDSLLYAVHNAYLASVRDLGLAYFLTGDETYAESARNILVQYADKYPTYPIHDVYGQEGDDASVAGARIHAQTLDEAVVMLDAIWGYDLAYQAAPFDESTRLHIENDLFRPAVEVIRRFDVGVDNWQSWHNAALGCIGLVLGDNTMVDWAINGQSGLLFQLRNGVLSDGFWHEASISYHFYVLEAMIWLVESSIRNGVDIGQDRIALYEAMFNAPLKLAYRDLRIPALDDGDIFSLQRPASDWYSPGIYEVAYTRFQSPCYAAIVEDSDRDSLSALLWGEADPQAYGCIILDKPVLLDGRGLAILKCEENDLYILMDYGVAGGGHGHLDKLNLVVFCLGEEFAPDPGRASYALPLHQDWYVQTASHNTVLVDQSSQQLVDGELDFFRTSDSSGVQMVRGITNQAYPGISMARTVILVEGGGYWIDIFDVVASQEHSYDWVFHGRGQFDPSDLRLCEGDLGSGEGFEYITNVLCWDGGPTWQVKWKLGTRSVRLTMLGCEETEVFTGEGVGQPQSERIPLVMVRRVTSSTRYVAFFEPSADGEFPVNHYEILPLRVNGTLASEEVGFGLCVDDAMGAHVLLYAPGVDGVKSCGPVSSGQQISWHDIG